MSKVWFVTGSSRGLGRAIVKAALAAGNKVVATARKTEDLADLAARYPDTLRTLALDVTDNDAVKRVVAEAHALFGRLDVVVNNAGYGDMAAVEDVTDADFKAQIDTNFYGTVYVTKADCRCCASRARAISCRLPRSAGAAMPRACRPIRAPNGPLKAFRALSPPKSLRSASRSPLSSRAASAPIGPARP